MKIELDDVTLDRLKKILEYNNSSNEISRGIDFILARLIFWEYQELPAPWQTAMEGRKFADRGEE